MVTVLKVILLQIRSPTELFPVAIDRPIANIRVMSILVYLQQRAHLFEIPFQRARLYLGLRCLVYEVLINRKLIHQNIRL